MTENRHHDRRVIDRLVDFRKEVRPRDSSNIKVRLTAREMYRALDRPDPPEGHAYPRCVLYRGYTLEAVY